MPSAPTDRIGAVDRSLSIVIPAYNEAGNILGTLDNVTRALARLDLPHEILVVDDGSTDGTGALVRANLARFSRVEVLVNDGNMGFGWSYRRGVTAARLGHVVMVHGDNAWGSDTLRDLFSHIGEADIIVGYTRHMWRSRSWQRTVISKSFTLAVNLLTRRHLRYYNGLQIHVARVLKNLRIESTGYGFQAEVLVKCLHATRTFVEVPMDLTERVEGVSKAFRIRNFIDVFKTLKVMWDVERAARARTGGARTGMGVV